MKRLVLLLLILSVCAWGQGARYDAIFPTTSTSTPPYLLATPNVDVNVCVHPANVVPCTNYATTYTSITLGTPCPNGAQVVLQGTATCVATGDAQGNVGFWLTPGTYDYTVCTPTCYGPFVITLSTGSGAGGGSLVFNPLTITPVCAPGCTAAYVPTANVSNDFKTTLSSNVGSSTFNSAGVASGTVYVFHIKQDGIGGHVFNWPTNVLGGITIDATATAGSTFTEMFMFDGSNLVALAAGVVYP